MGLDVSEPMLRAAEGVPARVAARAETLPFQAGASVARGFALVRCPDCGFQRLVAFSCKAHVCPSCNARRMEDTAGHLVRNVFPDGFSLHACVWIHANDRQGLERLCRYAVHPPFTMHRLSAGLAFGGGLELIHSRRSGRASHGCG